ncbi:hypothetical protein [Candidatus Accumulibacter phosphatis]|jgi:hypothetical protein|uniref:hypothetical protein n=1 Tax=Candidatus Accumulibacter phosphatis TaxID=327160 RepID=UPI001B7ED3CC|nr:hypothetical protein [Candidatus Accumulibacter phosphatis]
MKWLLALPLLAAMAPASAGETISVCYNYACLAQSQVHYVDAQLAQVQALLGAATSASDEREKLALAIGQLHGWAGRQTPIAADRGGNTADDGVYGRMDCIDHSTTTTRLLRLLEERGWLRFHRVLEPVSRVLYMFQVHYSAQIEEIAASEPASDTADVAKQAEAGAEQARYVVDTWFRDNGRPAVVIGLQDWFDGQDDGDGDAGRDEGAQPKIVLDGRGKEQNVEP